jgi:quercetin dioxygenase-like cupin family protein
MKSCIVAVMSTFGIWSAAASAQAPNVKVMFENASIRVELSTFEPGSGTGLHSIVTPETGVVLEGELMLESPQGRQTLKPGEAFWIPGLTPHDLRNTGRVAAKVWGVFMKRCD